ncbi:DAK2 domain-containing protein [Jiangella alba]|uniref:Dihydroxyacetone kinase, C-terminal domain n=1 Tax=Jiangella alba TaxID=561176 RepID=A0A1H5MPU0_9ACTN|nr:DAK2 domain-containing protein [Jiangella alba]SEE90661.1 dihydroxyacetone kinase, C-terminal domain [Jiangella alba]
MRVDAATAWIAAACDRTADAKDELTELDAAAGDGDLGVTVAAGATEVAAALRALGPDAAVADVLRAAGAAFARGNPSSFAALVGGGLVAAARVTAEAATFDPATVRAIVTTATSTIAERGGSAPGDRTVLDVLVPLGEALTASPPASLAELVSTASAGVDATTTMVPARGRAAWVGERGLGVPDGGATAVLRFLQALESS